MAPRRELRPKRLLECVLCSFFAHFASTFALNFEAALLAFGSSAQRRGNSKNRSFASTRLKFLSVPALRKKNTQNIQQKLLPQAARAQCFFATPQKLVFWCMLAPFWARKPPEKTRKSSQKEATTLESNFKFQKSLKMVPKSRRRPLGTSSTSFLQLHQKSSKIDPRAGVSNLRQH